MVGEQVRLPKLFGTVWKGRRQAFLGEIGTKAHLPAWQRRQRVSIGSRCGPPTATLPHSNILHRLCFHHVPFWALSWALHISDIASSLRRLRVEPLLAATLFARHFLFHVPRPAHSPFASTLLARTTVSRASRVDCVSQQPPLYRTAVQLPVYL